MKLYNSPEEIPYSTTRSIIIGTFDGIHHGHKQIIAQAEEGGFSPLVVTFTPHPRSLLSPGYAPPLITTDEERANLFCDEGVCEILLLPFEHYVHLTADQFLTAVILPLNPKKVVVGFNFFFGRNQSGNSSYLEWWCKPHNINVVVVPPVIRHGIRVSSSSIRELILQGKIEQANDMLSRPLFYTGKVTTGKQKGKSIGFATLNIKALGKVLPPNGVYLSTVTKDDKEWYAVTNIGTAPTISPNNKHIILESHIIDKNKNIPSYDDTVKINLLHFIRFENKFLSILELQHAISSDIELAKEIISKTNTNT